MKTILVPVDYSDASLHAARYAADLATSIRGELILFHAFQIPLPTGEVPVTPVSFDELQKAELRRIKKLESQMAKKHPEIKFAHRVKPGFPSEAIAEAAQEARADLVVMGVRGESPLNRALMGSHTVAVMNKIRIPLLAVPQECNYRPVRKMVLAYDYSEVMPPAMGGTIRKLLRTFGATLQVLHVAAPDKTPVYENAVSGLSLQHSLRETEYSLYFPEGNDRIAEINRFTENSKAEWLIMLPHKHDFLWRLFHKSNTKEMVFHTQVPLLSLHY